MKIRNLFFAGLTASAAGLACTSGSSTTAASATSTPGAKSAAHKGGAVLAHFGDETITADEVTAKLNERSPFERARMTTLDKKKEFVEQMARFDLLADEAKKRGLDSDPEVVHAMQTVMVRKLIQQEIDENPEKKKFTDDELQAYYNAHLEDFQRPEMVRLSEILLQAKDAADAQKRKKDADGIEAELKAKANDISAFGQMVAKRSEDPATKMTQGDLKFLSKQQLTERYGAALADAGFALKQGEVSAPIVTDKGVYILKLTGRTPAVNQGFDQAKGMLGQRLWYDKRTKLFDAFVDDLKKKSSYTVDEAELEKFQVNPTAPTTNLASLTQPGGMPPIPVTAEKPAAPSAVPANMHLPPAGIQHGGPQAQQK